MNNKHINGHPVSKFSSKEPAYCAVDANDS